MRKVPTVSEIREDLLHSMRELGIPEEKRSLENSIYNFILQTARETKDAVDVKQVRTKFREETRTRIEHCVLRLCDKQNILRVSTGRYIPNLRMKK